MLFIADGVIPAAHPIPIIPNFINGLLLRRFGAASARKVRRVQAAPRRMKYI